MDSVGVHLTWYNKHADSIMYSRINRVLGNVDWFQQYMDTTLNIMAYGVSDHAIPCLKGNEHRQIKISQFKFLNSVSTMKGFLKTLS